jgi:hypothetical protein
VWRLLLLLVAHPPALTLFLCELPEEEEENRLEDEMHR